MALVMKVVKVFDIMHVSAHTSSYVVRNLHLTITVAHVDVHDFSPLQLISWV